MVLHYANLAASAGGVDAFLIGSELKALTRVRSASGVYPAVTALVDARRRRQGDPRRGHARHLWRRLDRIRRPCGRRAASEVRFPLDPLWASPAIDAVGIDYYAPLSDWRDTADQLDRALDRRRSTSAAISPAIFAPARPTTGSTPTTTARDAQTRTPITDGLGKPWMFRAKDLVELVGATRITSASAARSLPSPTAWAPQSKPIWLTEIGCPAVDKGANQPSVFPDPKSAEAGLPHFSSGGRDDLIQRRYLEACWRLRSGLRRERGDQPGLAASMAGA